MHLDLFEHVSFAYGIDPRAVFLSLSRFGRIGEHLDNLDATLSTCSLI